MKIQKFFVLPLLAGICYVTSWTALFAQATNDGSLVFAFKYVDGKKYTVNSVNYQTVTDDGIVLSKDAELKNHISLEVQSALNDGFYIIQTTEFTESGHLRYEEKGEYYQTPSGITTVPSQYSTPLVRSIPRFQTRSIRVGESWHAQGIDTIQVPIIDVLRKIPVDVTYRYMGLRSIPKSVYTRFMTSINTKNAQYENHDTYVSFSKAYPTFTASYKIENYRFMDEVRKDMWGIDGSFFITIWWHAEYGRPVFSHEKYEVSITNENAARVFRFSGTSFARVEPVVEIERENEVKAIQEALEKKAIDVEVGSNEKGITIRLPHVRFHSDSAELLDNQDEKLDIISQVLKKYPKRRVLIEGHTALAGSASSRKTLSIERAKTIKNILEVKVGDGRHMLFRGWGAEKPLVPNTSEKNKQKNRRVEITILEN